MRTKRPKMKCPLCESTNVDQTCRTFQKDVEPEWTGWYCYNCGYWWEKNE